MMSVVPDPLDLAAPYESPSIGEEISAGHPSLAPNISSSNLRGPLNFQQADSNAVFGGPQETSTSS